MIGFEEKWKWAPEWQRKNYLDLLKEFKGFDLIDNEKCKLLWLGYQDQDTRNTFISLFKKCKEAK